MKYLVCRVEKLSDSEERFKNPYDLGFRKWHETFELAKKEAQRLCEKENCEFAIFSELGRAKPQPKTIFEDYR